MQTPGTNPGVLRLSDPSTGVALKPGRCRRGVEICVLPAGRYAVLTHKGPHAELGKAYQWLFGPWLAESGESAGPAPAVERYLNTPLDAGPTGLLTEIHMQL